MLAIVLKGPLIWDVDAARPSRKDPALGFVALAAVNLLIAEAAAVAEQSVTHEMAQEPARWKSDVIRPGSSSSLEYRMGLCR